MGTTFEEPGEKQLSSFPSFIFAYSNPLPEEWIIPNISEMPTHSKSS